MSLNQEQRQCERNATFTTLLDTGKLNLTPRKNAAQKAMTIFNVNERELYCQWASTETKPLEL